jgi:hypothetical protein
MSQSSVRCIHLVAAAFAISATFMSVDKASAEGGLFGFFERLGQPFPSAPAPPPAIEPSYSGRPLEMRVRPRRAVKRESGPRRSDIARDDVVVRQKEAYARLNPATNPDWYLQDPTLRRGDLVVLKTGIMVFEGQREPSHEVADFRPVIEDRRLSKADRLSLGKVATAD